MSMEQVLYAKVVVLRQKYFRSIAAANNKNKVKFKFQGQSARSQHCFDLDFDLIEVNFSKREPDFYKNNSKP